MTEFHYDNPMKTYKCYLAGGWFNDRDECILTFLEDTLSNMNHVMVYRPRKDGVKLTAEAFHDHNLRKKVFQSNVDNIDSADFLVSSLDSGSDHLDTGTVWETAYAIGKGIPVLVYQEGPYWDVLQDRLGEFIYYLTMIHTGKGRFDKMIGHIIDRIENPSINKECSISTGHESNSPIFLCDSTGNSGEIAILLDTLPSLKVVTNPKAAMQNNLDMIMSAPYLIIPTDTKDSCLTFYMGLAYALGTPVFTYSSKGAPLNLMLIFSVVKHITGIEDLKNTITQVSKKGLKSFGEYDTSGIKVY